MIDLNPAAAQLDSVASTDGGRCQDMLAHHVPLTLIMDLLMPQGPDSHGILAAEGAPTTTWWVTP